MGEGTGIVNLALIGHGGTGKTTLAEQTLYLTKASTRLGRVEDGTTVSDFDEEEKARKSSVDTSILRFSCEGKEVNLLDTPGYPDFLGQVIGALRAVDMAWLVVSAPAGIQVNTRRVWELAGREGIARGVVINKTDADGVDPEALLASLQQSFGGQLLPLFWPAAAGAGFKKVHDVLKGEGGTEGWQKKLLDAVVEADDALLGKYLEGASLSDEEVASAVRRAVARGFLVPVCWTSAVSGVGVAEWLRGVCTRCPSAGEVSRRWPDPKTNASQEVAFKSGTFTAQVFKTVTDPFVGRLCYFRVFSGALKAETQFHVARTGQSQRFGHLLRVHGREQKPIPQAVSGDILAVAKVEGVGGSDTIASDGHGPSLPSLAFPVPMVSLAVEPKSRGDEQKISMAMQKVSEEDTTFRFVRDAQTTELVVSGMSALHLDIVFKRLKRRFDLEVLTREPKIPYRETVTGKGEGHYRHKKQTGGAGQFAEVYLRVEPLERGRGFEFVNDVVGGAIPLQFIPSCEKGVQQVLASGASSGYPFVDVRASVYDGKEHPVDSKDIAFQVAAREAFKLAIQAARPVLLEPIVHLEVTIPSAHMGDVAGDLSGRRGRILGMEQSGEMQVVKAQVPLAEIQRYSTDLGSMTGGQGAYTVTPSHYDVVPSNLAAEIVARSRKQREATHA
jgi:elongation factor G